MPRRTIVKVYPRQDDKPCLKESPAQSLPTLERPGLNRRGTSTTLNNEMPDTELWLLGAPPKYGVPKNGDPWEICYEKVRSYDDDMCDGWRGEIDNLLIFAGLFSAVVTAFLIESYQSLFQDPNDVNAWLLQQILLQLHNANTQNTAALNMPLPSPPTFSPSAKDIRINVFWFMSLALSVAVVIVGILCSQWIREYERDTPLDPQDAIALRHVRHEGLLAWKVPSILMALPVMLHSSLILFFVGLIDLLWSLNHIVAFFVTAISGLVLFFIVATTLLPTLQLVFFTDKYLATSQCAYKSAQSWVVHSVVIFFMKHCAPKPKLFQNNSSKTRTKYSLIYEHNGWADYDMHWRKIRARMQKEGVDKEHAKSDLVRSMVWIDRNLGQSVEMIYAVYHCLSDFKCAAQSKLTISDISEKIRLHLESEEMNEYLNSLPESEQREVIATFFLEMNDRAFPQLDQYQIESVIRILNTRLNPKGQKENINIVNSLPFLRWPFDTIRGMPDDLVTQLLTCTEKLVRNRQIIAKHDDDIWNLLRGILSNTYQEENNPSQELHTRLAYNIILTYESNLDSADISGVKISINRIINTIQLDQLQDPDSPSARVIAAISKRLETLPDGVDAVFKSPDEKTRWLNIKKSMEVPGVRRDGTEVYISASSVDSATYIST